MNFPYLRRAVVLLVGLLPFVAVTSGCGEPATAEVSGKITLKGTPPNMEGLTISFLGADGRPMTVRIAPDGSYKATGAPVGEVKVGFWDMSEAIFSKGPPNEMQKADREETGRAKEANKTVANSQPTKMKEKPVPQNYHDPRTSGIATTLNPGSNTFDFDIK